MLTISASFDRIVASAVGQHPGPPPRQSHRFATKSLPSVEQMHALPEKDEERRAPSLGLGPLRRTKD